MDGAKNPYVPGAGLRPAVFAGRDEDIEAFQNALERRTLGLASRGIVLTGLRGVGKTVLLNYFAEIAGERDWIVCLTEARSDQQTFLGSVVVDLSKQLRAARGFSARRDLARRALASVKALSLSIDPTGKLALGIDVEASGTGDVERDIQSLAVDTGRAAQQLGVGVCVLVDEMQDLDSGTLSALCAAVHAADQRDLPFLMLAAGLPDLPGKLAGAKAYAERLFEYRKLDELEEKSAREAIVTPSARLDVRWHDDAVTCVVDASGGYPYFLQEFGNAIWNLAKGPEIDIRDAEAGVAAGASSLEGGFFRSRWDRATAAEQRYMRAMALDASASVTSETVAARLGTTSSNTIPARSGLLGKGLIYAPEMGRLAFTVPGMDAFIRRQADEPEPKR